MTCTVRPVRTLRDVTDLVAAHLPKEPFRRICIKPNWVKHQEHEEFPIRALVISTEVIEAPIDACFAPYAGIDDIVVSDVPLIQANLQEIFQAEGWTTPDACPRANAAAYSTFYLPSHPTPSDEDVTCIAASLAGVLGSL